MRYVISAVTTALTCAAPVVTALSGGSDTASIIERVGGDREIRVFHYGYKYRCGDSIVETPLPEGYPAPTPPGAIDLKQYPTVRRAEVSGRQSPDRGRNGAFFTLFRHIKKRDIAMTSPVEMDYPGWSGDASSEPDAWTMSFLYRTPDNGPVEESGNVRVVDTMPLTVIAIGLQGKYGRAIEDRGLQQLMAWLDGQNEWERAGSPRVLYYNGPSIRDARKWAEVQVPVRRAGSVIPPAAPDADGGTVTAGEEVGAILPDTFRRNGADRQPAAETGPGAG